MKASRPNPYNGVLGSMRRAVDAAVDMFAPVRGLDRLRARMNREQLLSYAAVRNQDRIPRAKNGSADSEVIADRQKIADLARKLVRDDAHAASAVRVFEENVIGRGLSVQSTCTPEATGLSPDQCEAWRRSVEEEFARWDEEVADATRHGTFTGDILRVVARSMLVDGECLGHAISDQSELLCELIDTDRLESPNNRDTAKIRAGVERDELVRPIAYHVLKAHPADVGMFGGQPGDREWQRIERVDGRYSIAQHVFLRERPGQSRGVSWFAAALGYSNHLHHYLDSELIAARVNSNVAMYVTRPADLDSGQVQADTDGTETKFHESMTAGTIEYLNPGEQITAFAPNRPGAQFEAFVTRLLRAIWAAPGLAYELVAKDFSNMNYSSARALLLECRRSFDHARGLIVRQFASPWFSNVILAAVAAGRLKAPPNFLGNTRAFLAHRWVPPAYGWVDPVKEIEASRTSIEANLSTPYDEASRAGRDAEEVVLSRARFLRFVADTEKQYGLAPGELTRERAERIDATAAPKPTVALASEENQP